MTFKKYNIKLKRRVFTELLHKDEAEVLVDVFCEGKVAQRLLNTLKSKQSPYLETNIISTKISKNDQSEENNPITENLDLFFSCLF